MFQNCNHILLFPLSNFSKDFEQCISSSFNQFSFGFFFFGFLFFCVQLVVCFSISLSSFMRRSSAYLAGGDICMWKGNRKEYEVQERGRGRAKEWRTHKRYLLRWPLWRLSIVWASTWTRRTDCLTQTTHSSQMPASLSSVSLPLSPSLCLSHSLLLCFFCFLSFLLAHLIECCGRPNWRLSGQVSRVSKQLQLPRWICWQCLSFGLQMTTATTAAAMASATAATATNTQATVANWIVEAVILSVSNNSCNWIASGIFDFNWEFSGIAQRWRHHLKMKET